MQRVLIMAGGTGGHVFPALVMANYWRNLGITVEWLGTEHGLEARLVPQAGFALHVISVFGLRGKGFSRILRAPKFILLAIVQVLRLLRAYKPDLVIGFGGFTTGPGGVACFLLGIPLVIHEQNAIFGFTNRLLSKIAQMVLVGFPHSNIGAKKVVFIGNPMRPELSKLLPPVVRLQRNPAQLNLLILGGSLGAQALNLIMPPSVKYYHALHNCKLNIYHQTGRQHLATTQAGYQELGVDAKLTDFISDMAEAYDWADLVFCRAGALTLTELCTVGRGSILVPFPHAVDDHQTHNAKFMVAQGAAILLAQHDLTAERLANLLYELTSKREKILTMAEAAYALRLVDVAEQFHKHSMRCVKQARQ